MTKLKKKTPTLSDGELLLAIGQHQDRDAFEKLFERYKHAGFSLAYRLTSHSDLAKDVFQDAMLAVWRSAASFRPEGYARGWILKIVACKSLGVVRREQRLIHKASRAKTEQLHERTVPEKLDKALDQDEVIEKLRELMGSLPRTDHQILALYFGAGIPQAEIAEKLSIPARTVSHRIDSLLKRIRFSLQQEGLASTLPFEWLAKSASGGWLAPKGISHPIPAPAEWVANPDAPGHAFDKPESGRTSSERVHRAKPKSRTPGAPGAPGTPKKQIRTTGNSRGPLAASGRSSNMRSADSLRTRFGAPSPSIRASSSPSLTKWLVSRQC